MSDFRIRPTQVKCHTCGARTQNMEKHLREGRACREVIIRNARTAMARAGFVPPADDSHVKLCKVARIETRQAPRWASWPLGGIQAGAFIPVWAAKLACLSGLFDRVRVPRAKWVQWMRRFNRDESLRAAAIALYDTAGLDVLRNAGGSFNYNFDDPRVVKGARTFSVWLLALDADARKKGRR